MGTPGEATLRRFAGASEAGWKAETQRLRQRKDAPARNLLDLIGAKGMAPAIPTCRIVLPGWIAAILARVA